MRAKATVAAPDSVPIEITMTGTLGEFRAIARALSNGEKLQYHAISGLLDQISDATFRMTKTIIPDAPETDNQEA